MTRHITPRELEDMSRWLNESPKNTKLEILIIVACMYWFLMFWLIDQICKRRRQK